MSDADLCKCGHRERSHMAAPTTTHCYTIGCPCTAFTPAQPATEDEPLGHPYSGNLCSGFGGTAECEWYDFETRQRCGKSPGAHERLPDFLTAPASEVPDLQAGIEGVLGEHYALRPSGLRNIVVCYCKEEPPYEFDPEWRWHEDDIPDEVYAWHRAHVAAAIVAYLHRTGVTE